ncbi:MAG TPA: carboxypeptidase regulatory-like domain-containing protein [Bryobacteraceae bacterium]|nr:carboxypeptidase regulatory-like domain-containing protein [Bryobacteraceae bacterium]
MIWRSLICFSIGVSLVAAGAVTGTVVLRDSKAKDSSGVAVWLTPAPGTPAAPPAPPGRATIIQKNKKFIPHVLAIRTGTAVDFPNYDPIFHNAFSNFSGQIFDVGLYKPGSSRTVMFGRPGVVRVFCNIHAAMSAVIVVVNTPWYATTAASGEFRIPAVPPGSYRLHVFHERATPEELSKVDRTVTVNAGETGVGEVLVSESGYLPAPHLNKHGRPYPPGSDTYKVLR